jgi:hypothetical protein
MMKKLAYTLILSLGLTSVCAEEVEDVWAQSDNTEATADADFKDIPAVTQEQHAGAIAWIKEHKVLTAAVVATLLGGAIAGTLVFCPSVRQATVNGLSTVKDGAVSAAQTGWNLCCDHKMVSIPVAVVAVIVLGLTTYDLCQDSEDSYIKSFINWLIGNQEEAEEIA